MNTCETKKKMYPTESLAEDALINAWTIYEYKDNLGPIGFYQCDICGAYHLTSKGEMNKRLAQYVASGKIKREAEAHRWMDKFKRKGGV
jgi:hypothetical protein